MRLYTAYKLTFAGKENPWNPDGNIGDKASKRLHVVANILTKLMIR
jgi:hypothetical protein